ncbi:MAG: hypothetical protein RBR08_03120 [Desulforegulaceae bacterium]|nr:hypothetical protein [Desulforegulaceae bacterium]
MNKKTWFFQITGWTCIAGSITLFALAGTDILLASESFNSPIYYVPAALLGISGVCLAICAYIYYKKKKQKKETINIFDILTKYSGQITPNEFSQESGLDPDESKQKLDDMHKNGICRLYVTESGLLIYHFPDFEFDGIVSKH